MIVEELNNDINNKNKCEIFWELVERVIRFLFSYGIFGVIVLINLHYIDDPFGHTGEQINAGGGMTA